MSPYAETIYLGYVDPKELSMIDKLVDSVLQRDAIMHGEETIGDLGRNIRNLRRRVMRDGS